MRVGKEGHPHILAARDRSFPALPALAGLDQTDADQCGGVHESISRVRVSVMIVAVGIVLDRASRRDAVAGRLAH